MTPGLSLGIGLSIPKLASQLVAIAAGVVHLVFDSFSRSDQDLTGTTTEQGGLVWAEGKMVASAGTPDNKIVSNQVQVDTPVTIGYVDSSQANVIVSSVLDLIGATLAGVGVYIIGRYAGVGDLVGVNYRPANSDIRLVSLTSGSATIHDSAFHVFSNLTYNLSQISNGSAVSGTLNDVEKVSATVTAHQTATKHGYGTTGTDNATSRWDDFTVDNV